LASAADFQRFHLDGAAAHEAWKPEAAVATTCDTVRRMGTSVAEAEFYAAGSRQGRHRVYVVFGFDFEGPVA
jgi:hypothetical protein